MLNISKIFRYTFFRSFHKCSIVIDSRLIIYLLAFLSENMKSVHLGSSDRLFYLNA